VNPLVAQLSIYYQQKLLKAVLLDQPLTLVGSLADNTIVLTYPAIAPRHLEITLDHDHYQIRDLGSVSGTQINQQRLPPSEWYPLHQDDTIQIGELECHLQMAEIASDRAVVQRQISDLPGTAVTPLEPQTLLQVATANWVQEFPLRQELTRIGQTPDNDIVIDQPEILPHHAQILQTPHGHQLISLSAQAELYLDGQRIDRADLQSGDVIQMGQHDTLTYLRLEPPPTDIKAPSILSLRDRNRLQIGRDPRNDAVIDHPTVSRFHSQIELRQGSWVILDLETSNGTFINGLQMTEPQRLRAGDRIRIGPCEFIFSVDETLIQQNEAGNLRIDALHLSKTTPKGVTLLDDISLSILPREFVAIVGVSGAGKSTLLDALNGLRPAPRGTVLVNDHDLYKNFNAYRTEVGYVPQEDIIHRELTVVQALDFAAKLRLPADTTDAERRQRVQRVLNDLELSHRQQVVVKQLSGGQRKRVSMGVELLTEPSLFFLDEATSGLDPGTELQMMRLLRKLADQGRTVMLITHATKNVMMCDMVLFLTKGGRVAYFGPPDQALTYFGVEDFDEIYLKVEGELSPEDWKQRFLASEHHQRYVLDRQKAIHTQLSSSGQIRPAAQPPFQAKGISAWRQWVILSQRYIATLLQERVSLLLMLSLAPILGLLDWVMWQRFLFDKRQGDGGQAFTMLFLSVLIATIVGSLVTMREIVKEADIYRRERMVGLKIFPYAFSKLWVTILLALYQSAIFLLTKELSVNVPGGWSTVPSLYITMFLVTLGGMVMGLLVSSLSSNQNAAPILTVFFLIPQITFAGSFLPLQDVGAVGQFLSQLTVTRWSFEAMVTTTRVGYDVARDPCWQKPESERNQLTEADKKSCACMGPNIFKSCNFPGIMDQYDAAVDQPEPAKPQDPGDPPEAPSDPYDLATVYRDDLDAYNQKVKDYKKKIDTWQDEFGEWKSSRGKAIASAEAILARFHRNQGDAFNVNVPFHWLRLVALISGMFGCLVLAQKRKDVL
jgi:ABC transport system ATP-binding/permease protein